MSQNRDYVKETYETFIKNAEGIDPTNPVKAVEAYFEKNASDELKARCKAEGKDAGGCWKFITAVARKVGRNCHIDPGVVYAMAMHYFEDVPVNWDRPSAARPSMVKSDDKKDDGGKNAAARNDGERGDAECAASSENGGMAKDGAEAPRSDNGKKKKAKKAKKAKSTQGFFFDLMEVAE